MGRPRVKIGKRSGHAQLPHAIEQSEQLDFEIPGVSFYDYLTSDPIAQNFTNRYLGLDGITQRHRSLGLCLFLWQPLATYPGANVRNCSFSLFIDIF